MLCKEITPASLLKYQGICVAERKWNGVRVIIDSRFGDVKLYNRRGIDYTERLPEITRSAMELPPCVIDGEIVQFTYGGKEWFPGAQKRCATSTRSKYLKLVRQFPVTFMAFDLLYIKKEKLMNERWRERKFELYWFLKTFANITPNIMFIRHYTDLQKALDLAVAGRWEGIVLKNIEAIYREGSRNYDQMKLKLTGEAIVKICGYTKSDKRAFGALVMVDNQGNYMGKCGQGFTDEDLERIAKKLELVFHTHISSIKLPSGEKAYHLALPFKIKIKYFGFSDTNKYKNAIFKKIVDKKV